MTDRLDRMIDRLDFLMLVSETGPVVHPLSVRPAQARIAPSDRREAPQGHAAAPQAPGAQRRNSAEDVSAEALTQTRKSREDHGEDCPEKGGLSSLCSVVKSGASIDDCSVIDAVDQRGAKSSLPPSNLPAPSD
jgi:hypothetical protein